MALLTQRHPAQRLPAGVPTRSGLSGPHATSTSQQWGSSTQNGSAFHLEGPGRPPSRSTPCPGTSQSTCPVCERVWLSCLWHALPASVGPRALEQRWIGSLAVAPAALCSLALRTAGTRPVPKAGRMQAVQAGVCSALASTAQSYSITGHGDFILQTGWPPTLPFPFPQAYL